MFERGSLKRTSEFQRRNLHIDTVVKGRRPPAAGGEDEDDGEQPLPDDENASPLEIVDASIVPRDPPKQEPLCIALCREEEEIRVKTGFEYAKRVSLFQSARAQRDARWCGLYTE